MSRDRLTQLIACAIAAALLVASGGLALVLSASAGAAKLEYADRAEDSDPPQVAAGIAMGAFRGIFVNWLWLRANELKEDGKYHEAVELSEAITTLQPRFPRVWVFHAWNLAYNISVTTQTPQERWQWVMAGVRLLRDEGIPYNPNDMFIYKELAWIFLHKIQGFTDDSNQYYKRELAEEWTAVLGPPPPPDATSTREAIVERYAQWLDRLANAPETLEQAEARAPGVKDLWSRARAAAGDEPVFEFLRRYEILRALLAREPGAITDERIGPKARAVADLMRDPLTGQPRQPEAWDALVLHLRKRLVTDEYHMRPDAMARFTRKYGPVDWRHPAAHSLYWAARGVEQGLTRVSDENKKDFDFVNTDRVVIQSVQELYRSGELYFDFLSHVRGEYAFYIAVPNVAFVDSYGQILQELIDRSFADRLTRAYRFYAAGYQNFLADAVRFFYRRGERARAEEYQERLRTWSGQNLNDPDYSRRVSLPLDEYVREEMNERYSSPVVAVSEVVGALQGAYVSGLLANNTDLFRSQFEYARAFHRYYMEQQYRQQIASQGSAQRMEQMDRDFRVVAGGVFAGLLLSLSPEAAEAMYLASPNDLRLYTYVVLEEQLRGMMDRAAEEARRQGATTPAPRSPDAPAPAPVVGGSGAGSVAFAARPFDDVFPPPQGIDEFKAELAARARERGESEVNIQQK